MFGRKVMVVLTVLVMSAVGACAETVEEILAKVQAKAATVKDLNCGIAMEMGLMGQKITMSGKMKIKLPDRMWASLDIPQQNIRMTIVSDGKTIYQEVDVMGRKMVNKIRVEDVGQAGGMGFGGGLGGMMGPQDPTEILAELEKAMDLEALDDEEIAGGMAWVLKGTFKPDYFSAMLEGKPGGEAAAEMVKSLMAGAKLYIGQDTHYLEKMEFLGANGQPTVTMTLSDLKFNEGVDDATFAYEPPKDAVVTDQTEMMVKQAEAAKRTGEKVEKTARRERQEMPTTVLRTGENAPEFSLTTLKGEKAELSKLKGAPVLLVFWATWHPASTKQLIEVNAMSKAFPQVKFLAVSLDEAGAAEEVKTFAEKKGITIPVAIGTTDMLNDYGISEMPSYVLIGADGTVAHSEQKSADVKSVRRTLEAASAKAAR